ncbi:nuclear transport factor 2 family protein [Nonomuraea sp. NPDC049637]|uniref:YybH family protein n=1 Tax=Nonomuraea sp. NPDC049637 TaxID=3154356 RepID=UPI00342D85DF
MSKISERRALLLAAIVPVLLVAGCSAGSNTQAMKGEASPATPTDTMMTPTETGMESPTTTETMTETATPTGTMTAATQPRAAVQNYFDALKSGNVDAVVKTFAGDAVVAFDGQATATGSQAVRSLYEKLLKDGADLKSATHTIDETRSAGSQDAFARATSKQGDTTYRELFMLTHQGGQWLISRFMNNQGA